MFFIFIWHTAGIQKECFDKMYFGIPIVAQRVKNPTGIHEDEGSIPGPAQ